MSIISAVLQGLLQGFTEFLPISSSGHLSLFQYFTGINSETSVSFSVMLHFGTLIAVALAFYKTIWRLIKEVLFLIRDIFTGEAFKKKPESARRMFLLLVISCVPLLLVLLFKDFVKSVSSDNDIIIEGICFLITALLLTLADRTVKGRINASNQTPASAAAIGFAQMLAVMPGISRSGSTISMGLICGLDRAYAVCYSFILGMPAVLAAGLMDMKDILESGSVDIEAGPAVIGMLVAALSGIMAIKLVTYIVKNDRYKFFAWYTFVLGISVIVIGLIEKFTNNAVRDFITSLIK